MGRRIFVVDDQNDILEVLEVVLTEQGFEVQTSFTTEGIVSKIENYQPDVILLDTFVGLEDGRLTCGTLKAYETTKNIPIIMFSANRDVAESTKRVGANDFIPKPFSVFTLINQIQKLLPG